MEHKVSLLGETIKSEQSNFIFTTEKVISKESVYYLLWKM